MDIASDTLAQVVIYDKYARFLKDKKRRETWDEIVNRNKEMHIRRYPTLASEIEAAYALVYEKKILPSMRSMQFGGKPIELNAARLYNCSFLPIDHPYGFSEAMFLLLSGCGVGYSVQRHHVEQLPDIRKPTRTRRFLVGDSIEGWSDAVKVLMKAYFTGKPAPVFDFSDIRAKGAKLITSGGKAPGPEPLRNCLHHIQVILDRKENGEKLEPIEVHDIMCHIADAVLSGGIRRSAMISLFDLDDEEMLTCKYGTWYEQNPQRGLANNSAVVLRHKITKKAFSTLWAKIQASNAGEPGIFFTNDKDIGTNPCAEIALRPFQFCNLTTINAATLTDQEDYNNRARAAAFIGTLQAGYTDFHYLRDVWKRTTERDALIGVSMTGIAAGTVLSLDMAQAAQVAADENKRVAEIIGIKQAARVTTVKPEGTSSLALGSLEGGTVSSGIHAYHNGFYLRRMKIGKTEPLYLHFAIHHPELLEDDFFKPTINAFVAVPQRAPKGAITRQEPALDLLARVLQVHDGWIKPGHRKGSNTNNVSTTVTLKDDEWGPVGEWMWKNREFYTALAVLPYDNHTYKQTPFEDITEERFNELSKSLHKVDLSQIIEDDDGTKLQEQLACAGGSCEIF